MTQWISTQQTMHSDHGTVTLNRGEGRDSARWYWSARVPRLASCGGDADSEEDAKARGLKALRVIEQLAEISALGLGYPPPLPGEADMIEKGSCLVCGEARRHCFHEAAEIRHALRLLMRVAPGQ